MSILNTSNTFLPIVAFVSCVLGFNLGIEAIILGAMPWLLLKAESSAYGVFLREFPF